MPTFVDYSSTGHHVEDFQLIRGDERQVLGGGPALEGGNCWKQAVDNQQCALPDCAVLLDDDRLLLEGQAQLLDFWKPQRNPELLDQLLLFSRSLPVD